MSAFQPVPGRACGECRACCIHLEIDDPELQKPDEVACPNLSADCGCLIYANRPRACREWFCGWRMINFSEAMRPDRSNLLLIPEIGVQPGYRKGGLRLAPLNDDLEAVTGDEMVDFAGKCVVAGVPIFLSYGAGADGQRVLVNPLLETAARAGDRAGFVRIMWDVMRQLVARVRGAAESGARP